MDWPWMTSRCSISGAAGIRVTVRRDAAHFALDPGFGLLVDLGFGHAGGDKGLARPQFAGIVRDRHNLAADMRCQVGATGLVALFLPRCDPGAFREDDDVETLLQALAPLGDDLIERILASVAVDRDHFHGRQPPAEEGNLEQFLLEDENAVGAARHAVLQGHGFPGRLVLGQDDAGFLGHVFLADDLGPDTQDMFDAKLGSQAPEFAKTVGPDAAQQGAGDDDQRGRQHRPDDGVGHEQGGAYDVHAYLSLPRIASTAAARSANSSVFSGKPPSALVLTPLPVSTSMGWQPAAALACRSRRESPIEATPARSTLKVSEIRRNMPGLGLRHSHCESAACGQ